MPVSRRDLLQGFATASVVSGVGSASRPAHAASPSHRRLLVLSVQGGFAPTAFDPKFGADGRGAVPAVDPDPGTVHRGHGGLSWAGGPGRPAMDRYFSRWSAQTALVRGLCSERLDHAGCAKEVLAGTLEPEVPEILARIAAASDGRFQIYGSSPWPLGHGEACADLEDPLVANRDVLRLRLLQAAAELRSGDVVAARVEVPGGWDGHASVATADGDFDALFGALDDLMDHLAQTPGQHGGRQLDEVTVVVLGDVARRVRRNYRGGRDHGPTHSVLLAGAGVAGGRSYGLTDDRGAPVGWDLLTGAARPGEEPVPISSLAAGLVAHVGLDPSVFLPGTAPLRAYAGDTESRGA